MLLRLACNWVPHPVICLPAFLFQPQVVDLVNRPPAPPAAGCMCCLLCLAHLPPSSALPLVSVKHVLYQAHNHLTQTWSSSRVPFVREWHTPEVQARSLHVTPHVPTPHPPGSLVGDHCPVCWKPGPPLLPLQSLLAWFTC